MIFSYDKTAEREIGRFIITGIGLGLITGLIWGFLANLASSPLLVGVGFAAVIFAALFINAKIAKTLYWNLAILLQAIGLLLFGLVGAVVGLIIWFAALAIVPALRYVLQLDNVISVSAGAILAWIISIPLFGIVLLGSYPNQRPSLLLYILICIYIGGVFWGISKIISSCFKEYRYRTENRGS